MKLLGASRLRLLLLLALVLAPADSLAGPSPALAQQNQALFPGIAAAA
jgi:hypothetical protein